jgi:hypothetical protein
VRTLQRLIYGRQPPHIAVGQDLKLPEVSLGDAQNDGTNHLHPLAEIGNRSKALCFR